MVVTVDDHHLVSDTDFTSTSGSIRWKKTVNFHPFQISLCNSYAELIPFLATWFVSTSLVSSYISIANMIIMKRPKRIINTISSRSSRAQIKLQRSAKVQKNVVS